MSKMTDGVIVQKVDFGDFIIECFCEIEYDQEKLNLATISLVLTFDLLQPIIFNREILEDTLLVDKLKSANGRLAFYWHEDIDSLEKYLYYWHGSNLEVPPKLFFIHIKSFSLFEMDQVFDNYWYEIVNLKFDHSA